MSYRQSDQLLVRTPVLSILNSGSNGEDAAVAPEQGPTLPDGTGSPGTTARTGDGLAFIFPEPQVVGCADAQPSPETDRDLGPTTACVVESACRSSTASPYHGSMFAFLDTEVLDWDTGGRSCPRGCTSFAITTTLSLSDLPNEILFHILGFLDVGDLLVTSRTNHHLRQLSLCPLLHAYRLRRTRTILPPLLTSPSRPSLSDLIARSIFLTHTSVVSRRLARSLVSISLARRLARRPTAEMLVQRCVLPRECVPGLTRVPVAPALVARRKAVERERVKDGLSRWVEQVWRGEVRERGEGVRRWEERRGVGRVWRLRRFWERVGRGEVALSPDV